MLPSVRVQNRLRGRGGGHLSTMMRRASSELVQITTLEPLTMDFLTRSWDNLISESPLNVVWRVMEEVCVFRKSAGARSYSCTLKGNEPYNNITGA